MNDEPDKKELTDIRMLMAGFHLVGRFFDPVACANAALNYAVQAMCADAIAKGSSQESVEQWAKVAGDAMLTAVQENFATARKAWEAQQGTRDKSHDN